MNKRGQAAAAAALIAIIAGTLILYIIFLQPEDRAEILGPEFADSKTSGSSSSKNITLLSESIGRLDPLSENRIAHTIPSVRLFTKTSGTLLKEKNSVQVRHSAFSEISESLTFSADPRNTENVLLSFAAQNAKGRLIISLNSEVIFDEKIESYVPAISVPSNLLERENNLTFRVSSPGAAIWRSNEFSLTGIKLVADVSDISSQQATSLFLVSDNEYNNIERARIRFQPDCDYDASPLNIYLNGEEIYSAVPDCGIRRISLEIPRKAIQPGENRLTFSSDDDQYFLSHISLETELEEMDFPLYFFDFEDDDWEDFIDNEDDWRVLATLHFVDPVERKSGRLLINGKTKGFYEYEDSVTIDISRYVEKDNNAIKIVPSNSMDIRKLEVKLGKE